MATRRPEIIGLATLLLTGGCEAEDVAGEAVSLRGMQLNGMQLNGIQLNGIQLNGFQLNGFGQLGKVLKSSAGATDYITITRVDLASGDKGSTSGLVGSELFVKGKTGAVFSGSALVNARLSYDLRDSGKDKKAEVTVVSVTPLASGSDVLLYQLQMKDSTSHPLCEDGREAILLGDIWDPITGDRVSPVDGTVTFACRGAALAKCVEFGYRPWASVGGVALRNHHQACTRMVRADYCGEGISHTTNGTPIHVLDKLGIQMVDPKVNYVVEAEWGPDGAICLNAAHMRNSDQVIACDIPSCSASFASGGLVQSGKIVSGY